MKHIEKINEEIMTSKKEKIKIICQVIKAKRSGDSNTMSK